MPVGLADFHTALKSAWDRTILNAKFRDFWESGALDNYTVLSELSAPSRQPFAYCVFTTSVPNVAMHMSAGVDEQRRIQQVSLTFNIWAEPKTGETRSAKQIAALLAEEIMKVFGGHPTTRPSAVWSLANGNVVQVQFAGDYSVQSTDARYQWVVNYIVLLDTPVMV